MTPEEHPLQTRKSFPWKKFCLIGGITVLILLAATWFGMDFAGRQRLDNAIAEAHKLGVPDNWEQYRQGIVTPDQENFAKHPIIVGSPISDILGEYPQLLADSGVTGFDPRIAYHRASQPSKSFEDSIKDLHSERDRHLTQINQIQNALSRPSYDNYDPAQHLYTKPVAHQLLQIAAIIKGNLLIDSQISDSPIDFTSSRDLLRHTISLTNSQNKPSLSTGLIQFAIFQSLNETLANLPDQALDDDTLLKLQEELEAFDASKNTVRIYQNTTAETILAFDSNLIIHNPDFLEHLKYPKYLPKGVLAGLLAKAYESHNRGLRA